MWLNLAFETFHGCHQRIIRIPSACTAVPYKSGEGEDLNTLTKRKMMFNLALRDFHGYIHNGSSEEAAICTAAVVYIPERAG